MTDSSGLIVHCPSCGQPLLAMPKVSSCNLSHGELRITFDGWHTPHKCGSR